MTRSLMTALVLTLGACTAPAPNNPGTPPPHFGHVVLVLEENTNYARATSPGAMPYLDSLAGEYGLATAYYADTHPSIGNYFMLATGKIITNNDGYTQTVTADNIVRHLVAAGKTWKSYAEDLPSVGYTGDGPGLYARRHNPFAYLSDVIDDSTQRKRLVPFTQFAADVAGDSLPAYGFVVPNLCHDAHDCALDSADTWLRRQLPPLLQNPTFQGDGLLIITFDESGSDIAHGGGRIVWVAVSARSKRGYRSTVLYQHASTLRLTMEVLGLSAFPGAAATAPAMGEFFN